MKFRLHIEGKDPLLEGDTIDAVAYEDKRSGVITYYFVRFLPDVLDRAIREDNYELASWCNEKMKK